MKAAPSYLLLADGEEREWERANVERAAALMRQRAGQPVNAMSGQLPQGLPSPFGRWPRGPQQGFVVTPDDQITLKPRESRTA